METWGWGMCGRVWVGLERHEFALWFGAAAPDGYAPNGDLRPTDQLAVVRRGGSGREAVLARWGLIPAWHRGSVREWKAATINARSEDVESTPTFRGALRHGRCLVPLSGFYEWTGERRARTKHLIRRRDGKPLVAAGLWEVWRGPDGDIPTCTILTCPANEDVAALHGRMPVLLLSRDWDRWLDGSTPLDAIRPLLCPFPPGVLVTGTAAGDLTSAPAGRAG